jgi:hypothetical protein
MKPTLHRCIVTSSHRFYDSTIQRFNGFTIFFCALIFPLLASAQFSPVETGSARSVSGQFIIIGSKENSPLARSPRFANDDSLVHIEPALLAVSAERIKESLWQELDIHGEWRGKIYFALHPARSLDEDVIIISNPSAGGWSYQVQLPDVLSRTRFTRAMTGVLLLEYANRSAQSHSAEIPAWLTDGLSQQLLAEEPAAMILSSPDKIIDGLTQNRTVATQRPSDALDGARRVLQNNSALTFGQLSWPNDAQLDGDDDGVYRASAQVFTGALLGLKNGPDHLRAMLADLPGCYNWQTAFQNAFQENFPRPLDLEKWWALQVVGFVARDSGPVWTPAASRAQLDAILGVPVEIRSASNSLPERAEISLQAVIRNFDQPQQAAIFAVKLRELELAQFRMTAPLAALAGGYRRAVADYLEQGKTAESVRSAAAHPQAASQKVNARDTLKKLDELDAQRRRMEADIREP